MSVYVDQPIFPYRGQMYCHVWADTLPELHHVASLAGLKKEWFQDTTWQHYDCGPRIREKLIGLGAIETDKYGPVRFLAMNDLFSDDPAIAARGRNKLEKLATIARLRDHDLFRPVTADERRRFNR